MRSRIDANHSEAETFFIADRSVLLHTRGVIIFEQVIREGRGASAAGSELAPPIGIGWRTGGFQ